MVVFDDRVFLPDTLPRVTFDRALAMSKSHSDSRHIHRRFVARSARSSILSANEYPEEFKLEVFQQTEVEVDAGTGVEVREVGLLLTLALSLMIHLTRRRPVKAIATVIQQSNAITFIL